MKSVRTFTFKATAAVLFTAFAAGTFAMKPVTVVEQGSFAAGGTVVEAKTAYDPYHPQAQGQTLHGDHAYVAYQVPEHRRALGLVMLHGAGQFSKTWDTTPDGRDGYRNLFLEKGYSVYLVDQPRRAAAPRAAAPFPGKSAPRPTKASGSDSSAWGFGPSSTKARSSRRTMRRWISSSVR